MNNNKILFASILFILMAFFTGCDRTRPYHMKIYVNNETNNNYLVYADSYNDTIIVSVIGNEKDFFIKKFPGTMNTYVDDLFDEYNIYIYNIYDSTYVHFIDDRIYKTDNKTTLNGRKYIEKTTTVNEIRINKFIVEHEWKYTINDSLVKLMCKNTHLTDSVFKLKK